MAITPISPTINLPILSEAVTIDVAPTSRFGQDYDTARITTIIRLAQPLTQPQTFLLPKSDYFESPTLTTETGTKIPFIDAIDAGALEQMKTTLMQDVQTFIQNINTDSAHTAQEKISEILNLQTLTTKEEIPANTSLIKFSYTKPIFSENGVFKLDTLVPIASFTLQNGGKIHAMISMPFDPYISTDSVEGTWINTSNQTQALSESNINNRTVLSAFWQQDPMLTITYRY